MVSGGEIRRRWGHTFDDSGRPGDRAGAEWVVLEAGTDRLYEGSEPSRSSGAMGSLGNTRQAEHLEPEVLRKERG